MTIARSQAHVTFIRSSEGYTEASVSSANLQPKTTNLTSEPSATFSHLQLSLHLPSPLQVRRPEGSEGGRSKETRRSRRKKAVNGGKAGRRAQRRAERAYAARRDRAPQVIDGFRTVVFGYVLERLLAGLEPTEEGVRAAQERIWAELEPEEQEKISIAGLEHPKTGPAFTSAIDAYLTKCRIREAQRKRQPQPEPRTTRP